MQEREPNSNYLNFSFRLLVMIVLCRVVQAKIDMTIASAGTDNATMVELCKKVAQYSVKTIHPRFFNLLYAGVNPAAMAGAWMTESLNANMYFIGFR